MTCMCISFPFSFSSPRPKERALFLLSLPPFVITPFLVCHLLSLFLLLCPLPITYHFSSPVLPLLITPLLSRLQSLFLLSFTFPVFFSATSPLLLSLLLSLFTISFPCFSSPFLCFPFLINYERERKERKTSSVRVCMRVHVPVHTSTRQQSAVNACGSMCVFRQISPWSFYLYCLLPKTATHSFFSSFFRLSLRNNNQTLTWVLNELKQAPKLCITQTRVVPFARSGWRLPKRINLHPCIFPCNAAHNCPVTWSADNAASTGWNKLPTVSIKVLDLRQRLPGTTGVSSALTPGPHRLQLPSPDVYTGFQLRHRDRYTPAC